MFCEEIIFDSDVLMRFFNVNFFSLNMLFARVCSICCECDVHDVGRR